MTIAPQTLVPRQLVILAGCLEELGGSDIQDIKGRVDAQKRIYLLQVAGINLGYNFAWDLFGPFSRGLANDLAAYREDSEVIVPLLKEMKLTDEATQRIHVANNLIKVPHKFQSSITSLEWLELIASLHFMAMTLFGWQPVNKLTEEDRSKVFKSLAGRKPHLKSFHSESQIAFQMLSSQEKHIQNPM